MWATLHCSARASDCGGFSGCRARTLEHRFNSCGPRPQLHLSCMWDFPDQGMESMSSALAGEFFTTEPPGKPDCLILSPKELPNLVSELG